MANNTVTVPDHYPERGTQRALARNRVSGKRLQDVG
jgi:hypothetical protein